MARKTEKGGKFRTARILLQLIIWILAEHQAFACERYLREKDEKEHRVYSIYENSRIAFIQIKTILCLEWSLFIDLADKEYRRFLSQRNRWRSNQNEEFHTTVLSGLFA